MHFVLLATGAGLRFISPLGLLCGLVSIVSGIVLYSQHQDISQGSAGEGVRKSIFYSPTSSELSLSPQYTYLSERRHDIYGFQYLALLFSLPKATFLWSVALFAPQVLFILYTSIGVNGLSVLVFFSTWFAVVFQYKLVPASFRWFPSKNTPEDSHGLASVV
jgi:hypothetical protein